MSRPIQIKITNDVSVVLDNVASYAVEKGLSYRVLKEGTPTKPEYTDEDYNVKAADTISVYFIGGHGLTFRVGEEITREDYDRISKSLKTLEFKLRDDGNTSGNKPTKEA